MNKRVEYNRDDIIRILIKKAATLGRSPTQLEVDADEMMPSTKTYQKLFGSFNKALETAGLAVNKEFRWSEDNICAAVKRFYGEHGEAPSQYDFAHTEYLPSLSTATQLYGGLQRMFLQIGVPYKKKGGMNKKHESPARTQDVSYAPAGAETVVIAKDRYIELLEAENQLLKGN